MLFETDVGIAVAVFYTDYHVAYRRNTGEISPCLFIGELRVVFFRRYKLVIKIERDNAESSMTDNNVYLQMADCGCYVSQCHIL